MRLGFQLSQMAPPISTTSPTSTASITRRQARTMVTATASAANLTASGTPASAPGAASTSLATTPASSEVATSLTHSSQGEFSSSFRAKATASQRQI